LAAPIRAPIRSMTGAGTAVVDDPALGRFEAEARSVNHRFLKTTVRAFGPLPALDAAVEDLVRARVQRGHVTATLRYVPSASLSAGQIDEAAFEEAVERLRAVAARHGLAAPTVRDVLQIPGVLADSRAPQDVERVSSRALAAVESALGALEAARGREGALLASELRTLLDAIGAFATEAQQRAKEIPVAAQARLQGRLGELLAGTGVSLDPAQVTREVALLAERADVREEIARLGAHVDHARHILDEGGPVGRRLDFLVQELHREANTVTSKSGDLALTRAALEIKAHVERLREQVQNIE
jgi:uncharacterized protein (TIGR00255 family)